jgi:hypothetical protein
MCATALSTLLRGSGVCLWLWLLEATAVAMRRQQRLVTDGEVRNDWAGNHYRVVVDDDGL